MRSCTTGPAWLSRLHREQTSAPQDSEVFAGRKRFFSFRFVRLDASDRFDSFCFVFFFYCFLSLPVFACSSADVSHETLDVGPRRTLAPWTPRTKPRVQEGPAAHFSRIAVEEAHLWPRERESPVPGPRSRRRRRARFNSGCSRTRAPGACCRNGSHLASNLRTCLLRRGTCWYLHWGVK